jgi:molybdopterin-guanine dinucleotide biosynthesis protein A
MSALSGIVLAGGAGRRLGADKPLVRLAGRTLLEWVAGAISPVCDEVVIAAGSGPRPGWPRTIARAVPDLTPGLGPLGGLQAGLREMQPERALVVACDMPFLEGELLRHMSALPLDGDAIIPVWQGRPQPLLAIYSRRCLPAIDAVLADGPASLATLLARVQVQLLPESELARFSGAARSFFSINTNLELELAAQLLRGAAEAALT